MNLCLSQGIVLMCFQLRHLMSKRITDIFYLGISLKVCPARAWTKRNIFLLDYVF